MKRKSTTSTSLLRWYFEPVKSMKRRFPKAAKKRRVVKKWEARFGKDVDWAKEFTKPNPFHAYLSKAKPFTGGILKIPYPFGD